MTTYLLDVNVLVALLDPSHIHHERAHRWFGESVRSDWVTVPITENGVVRIVSHPSYSNSQPTPVVLDSLRSLCAVGGHRFEPDSVSVLGDEIGPLLSSGQVTDTYLIALAASLDIRLATFDKRMVTSLTEGSERTVLLIP